MTVCRKRRDIDNKFIPPHHSLRLLLCDLDRLKRQTAIRKLILLEFCILIKQSIHWPVLKLTFFQLSFFMIIKKYHWTSTRQTGPHFITKWIIFIGHGKKLKLRLLQYYELWTGIKLPCFKRKWHTPSLNIDLLYLPRIKNDNLGTFREKMVLKRNSQYRLMVFKHLG